MRNIVILIACLAASAAHAENSPVTPADTIHPNIHQNNGAGSAACPGDQDQCQNMHGIGNNPGQSGDGPNDDGVNGFRNELDTVHGGILDYTSGDSSQRTTSDDSRVLLCHYFVDPRTGETATRIINVPAQQAQRHLDHGDVPLSTGDDAADAAALADCSELLD